MNCVWSAGFQHGTLELRPAERAVLEAGAPMTFRRLRVQVRLHLMPRIEEPDDARHAVVIVHRAVWPTLRTRSTRLLRSCR